MPLTIVLTDSKDVQSQPVTITVKSLKSGSVELVNKLKPEDIEKVIEEFKNEGWEARVIHCPWFSEIKESL
jgi:hypothetical protein